nr:hypothetical protein [uncultured Cohaesibacter sp.]
MSAPRTLKASKEFAGAISNRNSKMPGTTFAISAKECKVGSKLAKVEGSVCHKCYAMKLQKMRPSVDMGWTANYLKATAMIAKAPEKWADAMAFQINREADKTGEKYHRWFDSGDLQSVEMLRAIVLTCERTPEIAHWLPTREAGMVKQYLKEFGPFPSNLVVRMSSTMIGDRPRAGHGNTSTVHAKGDTPVGYVCPARDQGNACGDCRACWDLDVKNVSYPLH